MQELVQKTEQYVEKFAKKNPDHPDLPTMYEIVAFDKQKGADLVHRQQLELRAEELRKPIFTDEERKRQ